MSQTRQASSNTSTISTPASSAPTFGSDNNTTVSALGLGVAVVLAAWGIYENVKNPAAVKAKAITDATNLLATHTEAMEEERKEWHVPRPTVEDPIKSFLNSPSHAYALLHGPQGCGKSEAVLAAVITKDGSLRKGVLTVKLEGEVGNLASFVCRKLKVAEGDESDLEEVLRGTKKKLGGAMPLLIIELDRKACSSEQITTATTFAKERSVDKFLCKIIIVLSDNAAVNTTTKGGDSRHKLFWVGDMEIDAAKRLLKERKFDPKEMGYGEVEDDEDKALRKLFAEVGTRVEVLVGILGSMETGQALGREMAAAKGTSSREAETREAKKAVLKHIKDRKDTIDLRLRLLLNYKTSGDVDKAENKKQAIKIIRRILDAREEKEKSADAKNKEVEVEFVPSILTTDTDLEPSTLSHFMREIDVNCHPLIYHPPSKSYRFHSTMVEKVARNSTLLAAEEKKLAAEEKLAARRHAVEEMELEEKKLAAEEKLAARKRAV